MKKILILFFVIVLVAVGVNFFLQEKTIDCGVDQVCFSENFKTCTPAKIFGGFFEVKGGEPASCEIFMLIPETKVDGEIFSEEMSMICITNSSFDTSKYETTGLGGLLMMELMEEADCQGTLADFYEVEVPIDE